MSVGDEGAERNVQAGASFMSDPRREMREKYFLALFNTYTKPPT